MSSFMSKLVYAFYTVYGYKKRLNDPEKCAKYIEHCRKVSAKKYKMVPPLKFKVSFEKTSYNGVQLYVFNRNSKTDLTDPGRKTILFFHGGAYTEQPVFFHWLFTARIAEMTNSVLLAPIYPKGPDHKWTETRDLALSMYKELLTKTAPENIVVMGDSSGGGFAAVLCQLLAEEGLPKPGKAVLSSPWVDISMSNPELPQWDKKDITLPIYGLIEMAKGWSDGRDLKDPMLSPLFGDLSTLPDTYVTLGGRELLVPDVRQFCDRARAAGVNVTLLEKPGMLHDYLLFPCPEAKKAQGKVADFINE